MTPDQSDSKLSLHIPRIMDSHTEIVGKLKPLVIKISEADDDTKSKFSAALRSLEQLENSDDLHKILEQAVEKENKDGDNDSEDNKSFKKEIIEPTNSHFEHDVNQRLVVKCKINGPDGPYWPYLEVIAFTPNGPQVILQYQLGREIKSGNTFNFDFDLDTMRLPNGPLFRSILGLNMKMELKVRNERQMSHNPDDCTRTFIFYDSGSRQNPSGQRSNTGTTTDENGFSNGSSSQSGSSASENSRRGGSQSPANPDVVDAEFEVNNGSQTPTEKDVAQASEEVDNPQTPIDKVTDDVKEAAKEVVDGMKDRNDLRANEFNKVLSDLNATLEKWIRLSKLKENKKQRIKWHNRATIPLLENIKKDFERVKKILTSQPDLLSEMDSVLREVEIVIASWKNVDGKIGYKLTDRTHQDLIRMIEKLQIHIIKTLMNRGVAVSSPLKKLNGRKPTSKDIPNLTRNTPSKPNNEGVVVLSPKNSLENGLVEGSASAIAPQDSVRKKDIAKIAKTLDKIAKVDPDLARNAFDLLSDGDKQVMYLILLNTPESLKTLTGMGYTDELITVAITDFYTLLERFSENKLANFWLAEWRAELVRLRLFDDVIVPQMKLRNSRFDKIFLTSEYPKYISTLKWLESQFASGRRENLYDPNLKKQSQIYLKGYKTIVAQIKSFKKWDEFEKLCQSKNVLMYNKNTNQEFKVIKL